MKIKISAGSLKGLRIGWELAKLRRDPNNIKKCRVCNKTFTRRGQKKYTAKYCSVRCKAIGTRGKNLGKESSVWKGGGSVYLHKQARIIYNEFNINVVCENCGSIDKIAIHHKDKNERNNNITNLQALCSSCHTAHHNKERKGRKCKRK